MKHLSVKKIATSVARAEDVPALLDAQGVEFQPIDCVDWAADYPYAPKVEFRIAHKGDAVLIEYRVSEQSVAAVAPHDNGRVWEDSCCEFFFQPEGGNVYYNVETNCAGTVLVGCGETREAREAAPAEVLNAISRWSSLGRHSLPLTDSHSRRSPHESQLLQVWRQAADSPLPVVEPHRPAFAQLPPSRLLRHSGV